MTRGPSRHAERNFRATEQNYYVIITFNILVRVIVDVSIPI